MFTVGQKIQFCKEPLAFNCVEAKVYDSNSFYLYGPLKKNIAGKIGTVLALQNADNATAHLEGAFVYIEDYETFGIRGLTTFVSKRTIVNKYAWVIPFDYNKYWIKFNET